jgi:phage terminase large subunit-like protein
MKLRLKPEELSLAEQFSVLSDAEQIAFLEGLYDTNRIDSFLKSWEFWGRPEQQLPDSEWDTLLILAGRGSGKTRMCAEAVHRWAENKNWHISLVGETVAEVRDVMVEGPSGLVKTAKPWNPVEYMPSKRRLEWPKTGTWATTYSGDSPDQLRGPNSQGAWLDELAKFRYPQEVWDNLMMVLRVGLAPKCIVSTTPRPIPLIKELAKQAREDRQGVVMRRWSTYRNIANLSERFIQNRIVPYEGTRYGRQELNAEILEDVEGALWNLSRIDSLRVTGTPSLTRIAVGVDPPGSTKGQCGIVVIGLYANELYVLDDMSMSGSPEEWGLQVVKAYHNWAADVVVPETNFGGDMVMSTIRAIDPLVPLRPVHASRGKQIRAQPISAYTEQGKMHHVGSFAELEDEICSWTPDEPKSPNRLDAYVWAATELLSHTPYGIKSKQAFSFGRARSG